MIRLITLLLRSGFFLSDKTRFFCGGQNTPLCDETHSFCVTEFCSFVVQNVFIWWDKARLFCGTKHLSLCVFFGTALQIQLSELECSLSDKRTRIYELEEQVQTHDRALLREQVFSVGLFPFCNRSPFSVY